MDWFTFSTIIKIIAAIIAVITLFLSGYVWVLYRRQFLNLMSIACHTVVDDMDDLLIILDTENRVKDYNPAAWNHFFRLQEKVLNVSLSELLKPEQMEIIDQCAANEDMQAELELNDQLYDVNVITLYRRKKRVVGKMIVLRDITKQVQLVDDLELEIYRRQQVEEQLKLLSISDPLTQLINRRHFFENAEVEVERASRYHESFAIILLEIDKFKKVNDKHGHIGGDNILIEIARACKKAVRKVDVLARFSGSSFAVLLPETDLENAVQAAERLRQEIESLCIEVGKEEVQVTASFGLAVFQESVDISVDAILKRAGSALDDAKSNGGNQIISK